jgi:N-acetylneuraminic acid mutarotase
VRWIAALSVLCACSGSGASPAADARVGPDAAPSRWKPLAPLPGGPRQETAVVALDGKVYVLGGFDENVTVVTDVEVYDVAAGTWRAVAPLPRPLHHANAAAVGGKVWITGALVDTTFAAIGDVYAYDPASDAWTAHTAMPAGTQRGAAAVGVMGTAIWVAGGYRDGSVADVSAYDTVNDTWDTSLPPLPEARDHLVGGVVSGVFYAIGGRENGTANRTGRVDALMPGGAWTARAPMLTARSGCAAGVVGGKIVVVGGEGSPTAPLGVFPETEAYDPAHDAWTALEPMRTPRHGTGAAGVGDVLIVPGGADRLAFGAVATVEAFSP